MTEVADQSRIEMVVERALGDDRFRERLVTDLGSVIDEYRLTHDEVVGVAVALGQRLEDGNPVDARAERAELFRIVAERLRPSEDE